MTMSIGEKFILASRLKLRFESTQGLLTVEQLWDLPLTGTRSIDSVALALNEQLSKTTTKSFITPTPVEADKETHLKFEIVKHVIEVRLVERDEKAKKQEKESQRKLLREAIAEKTNEELKAGTVDELKRKLAELGG